MYLLIALLRDMSFRGGSRIAGRAIVRPSQIFKKRHDLVNSDVPINSNATLIGNINIRETGTVYAVKLSLHAFPEAGTNPDIQRVAIYVRCVPEGTGLPDLTVENEIDTLNGFNAVVFHPGSTSSVGNRQFINEKFRYRRKCDDNTDVQLIAQHTNTQGTGRVVNITGLFSAIVRVR